MKCPVVTDTEDCANQSATKCRELPKERTGEKATHFTYWNIKGTDRTAKIRAGAPAGRSADDRR
jgi:hypothetical protein